MQPSEDTKAQYFIPKWFVALLLGRLSFGDTFWAGLFGSMLLFVPAGFVLTLIASIISPGDIDGFLIIMMTAYAVYMTLLLRVIVLTGWRCKTTGGWRWVGMGYMVMQTTAHYMLVLALITEGSAGS